MPYELDDFDKQLVNRAIDREPTSPTGCFLQVVTLGILVLTAGVTAVAAAIDDDPAGGLKDQPAEEAASTSTTATTMAPSTSTSTTIASTEVIAFTAVYGAHCDGDFAGEVEVHSEGTVDVYLGGGGGQRQLLGSSPLSSDGSFEVSVETFTLSGRVSGDQVTGSGEFGLFTESDSLISGDPCPFELSSP